MTNREALNQYIRKIAEKQIAYIENMSDEDLIQRSIEVEHFGVHINIGDKISYFKAMTAGMPVGSKDKVLSWFKEPAPETIPWDKIL